VDCAGVGYEVKISLNTFSALGSAESGVVYTRLIVREDAHVLYGFHAKEEREMFNHLISVSGIGPNTAILMLSSLLPEDIAKAIQTEDVVTIQKIKGIGTKTAQRVILDLKGKVVKLSEQAQNIFAANNTNRFDALTALVSLGFDKKSAEKALERIDTGAEPVEILIKEALKVL
jgi:Holliday junction DNA helicase RuvA